MKRNIFCLFFFFFIEFGSCSKAHEAQVNLFPFPNATNQLIKGKLLLREGEEDPKDPSCLSTINGKISNCDAGEYVIALFYTISFDEELKSLYDGCKDDEHLNFTAVEHNTSTIFGCSPHKWDDSLGYFITVVPKSWCQDKTVPFVAYGVVSLDSKESYKPNNNYDDQLIAYLERKDGTRGNRPIEYKDQKGHYSITVKHDSTDCTISPKTDFYNCDSECCSHAYPGYEIQIIAGNQSLVGVYSRVPGVKQPLVSTAITNPPISFEKATTTKTDQTTTEATSTLKTDTTSIVVNQASSTDITSTTSASPNTITLSSETNISVSKIETLSNDQTAAQPEPPNTPGLIVGIVFASLILTGMIIVMIRRNRVAARKDGFKRMYGDF